MPFLGSQPAEVALTTGDLGDAIVTEAKMANDAIGLAELKAGTDGELITWDASGNPTTVAAGTSGHFLKSQGAGSVPVFAEAGGGAYNFISDTNCSGASSFEINDLSATYDNYLLLMTGVKNNNSVSYLRTTVGTSSSYASSGYYWSRWGVGIGNGGSGATVSQNGSYFEFSSQGPTNSIRNYQMHIHRKSNGGTRCTFMGFNMGQENATWDESHYTFGGFIDTGSLIDDIKFEFLTSTGQITVSSARLYGIVNS
tara:strand:+ start:54 stop:818 length:765 start_codon:yes stop_codon:yes gene_type:complete